MKLQCQHFMGQTQSDSTQQKSPLPLIPSSALLPTSVRYHLSPVQATHRSEVTPLLLSLSVSLSFACPLIMQTLLSPAARAGYFTAAPPPAVTARPLAYHLPLRSISDRHVPSRTLSSSSSLSLPSFAAPNHRGSKLSFTTIRASSTPISQTFTSPNDESEKAKLLQVLFLLLCQFYSILFDFRENVGKHKNMKFQKLLMN